MAYGLRISNAIKVFMALTTEQIQWARLHDWFVSDNKDGSIIVLDESRDGSVKKFNNFTQLLIWAGY